MTVLTEIQAKVERAGDCPEGRCRCPLLTVEELAAWIGKSRETIVSWRYRSPELGPPVVRVGRSVRYRPCEVLAWLDSNWSRGGV